MTFTVLVQLKHALLPPPPSPEKNLFHVMNHNPTYTSRGESEKGLSAFLLIYTQTFLLSTLESCKGRKLISFSGTKLSDKRSYIHNNIITGMFKQSKQHVLISPISNILDYHSFYFLNQYYDNVFYFPSVCKAKIKINFTEREAE